MSEAPDRVEVGSSRALQGCLFGAVALFVIMFLVMLYLGYTQFRNNTDPAWAPQSSGAPMSYIDSPVGTFADV